nr:ABC transporter ATP-binding protein [Tumebacillus amylolyticus]
MSDLQDVEAPFDIRFEGVSFKYPDSDSYALQDVTFTISHGERLALVGANGSGKSTLIRLLLGLSRPTAGCIYVNGVPLDNCSLAKYREHVTVAFQDFAQYHRTVRENIGFGHLPSLPVQPLLEQAAEQSGAAEFISRLPQGYDQQLGAAYHNGVDLSGGQWQKTAMARAYLRPATLLVMDEPTASLDPLAEVEVYRQFSELAEGKTALLVSHRLGSATLADRILVLKQGKLVEVGNHQGLLRESGEYAKLFTSQAQWYRQDEEQGGVQDEHRVADVHL